MMALVRSDSAKNVPLSPDVGDVPARDYKIAETTAADAASPPQSLERPAVLRHPGRTR